MNNVEKPIFWHHGLFLRPHHFQQNNAFLQSLLTPHNQYHTPYFWGCGNLVVNDASLAQRVFEISECEILFQDGTWVRFPDNAVIDPRSFEDISFDTERDEPLTVYLGVKKIDRLKKNVTSLDDGAGLDAVRTRYVCPEVAEEVNDIHGGSGPADMRKMSHVIKIVWHDEADQHKDYLLMPICRLELHEESVVISRQYVHPCYSISHSDTLMQMLKGLRENIISRCRVFESFKITQGFGASDFDAHFLPHLLVLDSLNRCLPPLTHLIELADFHPQYGYLVIRQIIGDLSTFTDRMNALGQTKEGVSLLPEYDHENLFQCFNEVQLLINELLREIAIGGESIINLIRQDNFFRAHIPADEFSDSYMYFLVVKSGEDADQIVNDLNKIVKIGPEQSIDNLISRALPGLPVRHRLVPPPGMPKRDGSYFFRIDKKHYLWQEIARTGDICLFWNNAPEDASIELVVSQI